jgi:hypothetical protein
LRNCPKVQQGQLSVLHLGNLVVEKGPREPMFHNESNLYPIGFKAQYVDSETGIVFHNEILDGADEISDDVPVFQVCGERACLGWCGGGERL